MNMPSRRHKKKKKGKDKSRSRSVSPFSARSATKPPRPLSPFSAKMTPGVLGVPAAAGVMNMPPEYQPPVVRSQGMNLPGAPLPDVRLELERIKSQKAEEEQKTTSLLTEDRIASPAPSSSPAVAGAPVTGFPVIDLTQPPPGYPPVHYGHGYGHNYPAYDQQDYDDKVRRFLQETVEGSTGGPGAGTSPDTGLGTGRAETRRRNPGAAVGAEVMKGKLERAVERKIYWTVMPLLES